MFFKRLSRSRSNSQSYVDTYHSPHDSKQSYSQDDARYASAPVSAGSDTVPVDDRRELPSSRQSNTASQLASDPLLAKETGATMYPRQSAPTEVQMQRDYNSPPMSAGAQRTNGYSDA